MTKGSLSLNTANNSGLSTALLAREGTGSDALTLRKNEDRATLRSNEKKLAWHAVMSWQCACHASTTKDRHKRYRIRETIDLTGDHLLQLIPGLDARSFPHLIRFNLLFRRGFS